MIRQISLITSTLKEKKKFLPFFLVLLFLFFVCPPFCLFSLETERINKQTNERGNLQNHLPDVSLKN